MALELLSDMPLVDVARTPKQKPEARPGGGIAGKLPCSFKPHQVIAQPVRNLRTWASLKDLESTRFCVVSLALGFVLTMEARCSSLQPSLPSRSTAQNVGYLEARQR